VRNPKFPDELFTFWTASTVQVFHIIVVVKLINFNSNAKQEEVAFFIPLSPDSPDVRKSRRLDKVVSRCFHKVVML